MLLGATQTIPADDLDPKGDFADFLGAMEQAVLAGWEPGMPPFPSEATGGGGAVGDQREGSGRRSANNADGTLTHREREAAAAEWEEFWDAARQRHYYHHKKSGVVQWTYPSEWHHTLIKQHMQTGSDEQQQTKNNAAQPNELGVAETVASSTSAERER